MKNYFVVCTRSSILKCARLKDLKRPTKVAKVTNMYVSVCSRYINYLGRGVRNNWRAG